MIQTVTPRQLSVAVSSLETSADIASAGTATNHPSKWRRIAAACEALAGITSTANDQVHGYMVRAAIALESLAGTTGAEETPTYSGKLKRIVDALEVQAGQVFTGSLGNRLMLAAAAAIFGATGVTWAEAPTFHIDPTVLLFPNAPGALTLGTDAIDVTGYMTSDNVSSTFHLTDDAPSGFALGMEMTCPSFVPLQDRIFLQNLASGTLGLAGSTYETTNGTEVGSNADRRTWHLTTENLVLNVADLMGNADASGVLSDGTDVENGAAPLMKVDADGVKVVSFGTRNNNGGTVLENLDLPGDTHNYGVFAIMRHHIAHSDTMFSVGAKSTAHSTLVQLCAPGGTSGRSYAEASYLDVLAQHHFHAASPPAISNRMQASCNRSLYGCTTVTTTGIGTSTGQVSIRYMVNENSYDAAAATVTRKNNGQGYSIGRDPQATDAGHGRWLRADMYCLVIFSEDQLAGGVTGAGRVAAVKANAEIIQANLCEHFGLVPYTKSIVVKGDSRHDLNGADGYNPAMLIADAANDNVRVMNDTHGGFDTADHYQKAHTNGGFFGIYSKIGGAAYGDDYVIVHDGTNSAGSGWPINNSDLYDADPRTTARGTEIYGAAVPDKYDATFLGSITGSILTYESGITGSEEILPRAVLTTAGTARTGTYLTGQQTGTPGLNGTWNTSLGPGNQASGTTFTAQLGNTLRLAKLALDKGFHYTHCLEMATSGSALWDDACLQLRTLIAANLLNDVTAYNATYATRLEVFDLAATFYDGMYPIGVDAAAFKLLGGYANDNTHPKAAGTYVMSRGMIAQLYTYGLMRVAA